jgi:tetratricopeptide (TPR) repeat protein
MKIEDIIQSALEHHQEGNLCEAERLYKDILRVHPENSDAWHLLGVLLSQTGDYNASISHINKSLEYNPVNAGAYNNLGISYQGKNQLEDAINCYRKAMQLDPDLIDAYYNLGAVFQDMGQPEEAIIWYRKALQLNPHLINAYYNLGIALRDKGNTDEAVKCYQKTLQYDPDNAAAHFNMSLVLLLSGNFKEGWKEFAWRWRVKDFSHHTFLQPEWYGSDITGQRILLYAEDGYGDTIQFIRYVALVKNRGAKIIVECQRELVSLLDKIAGIDNVLAHGEKLPEFDLHCSLLRLPSVFDTTLKNIPLSIPYITVDSILVTKWKNIIHQDNSRIKIGLVWSGSLREGKLRHRSCSLDTYSPLAEFDNVTFYSLQKGEAAKEAKNPPRGMKFVDYTEELNDFSDTAALIENLDLVISVDTAVAHLAGSLGKPAWTIVSFPPDWRWLLKREDSPWYPTMKLFRQSSPGDWEPVIESVSRELESLLVSYRGVNQFKE